MIEEYKTLRNESSDSLKLMNSALGFGVVGFGTIFGISSQITTGHGLVRIGLFVLVIPLYSILVMGYWLSELRRAQRAFAFVGVVSARINVILGKDVLIWENFIHQNISSNSTSLGYVMTCSIFILMSLSGLYYGSALCFNDVPSSILNIIMLPATALRIFPAIFISYILLTLSIVTAGLQMGQILFLHLHIGGMQAYYVNQISGESIQNCADDTRAVAGDQAASGGGPQPQSHVDR
jgi:hypothetical protein